MSSKCNILWYVAKFLARSTSDGLLAKVQPVQNLMACYLMSSTFNTLLSVVQCILSATYDGLFPMPSKFNILLSVVKRLLSSTYDGLMSRTFNILWHVA